MLRVNHAIVHVCDFESCVNVFSTSEVNLIDRKTKSYVGKTCRKALGSIENRRGTFLEGSGFAAKLNEYFASGLNFVDFSVEVANFLAQELGHMENPESVDILVADFEDEAPKPSSDASEEELEASYQAQGKRYVGIFFLPVQPAFMHEAGQGELGPCVDIARHHAILPKPSQKLSTYCLIERESLQILFVDKEREISGEQCLLIPDKLLECESEASTKEVVDTAVRIAEEVATEHGANAAVAASKAKAYVNQNADENEYLAPWDMADEVFEDENMKQAFDAALTAEHVPEKVPVKKSAATRLARNHKIRTNTGIEITFPSEYSDNPDFIEFLSMPNGLISIELKNISNIENR